jgi:small multidrug resistance family-3 protein
MDAIKTSALFSLTALAELLGCYLPYLWLRKSGSPWLLLPAAFSLVLFSWLLSLHPTGAGRTYAAYGGIYVMISVFWIWFIEGQRPDRWDLIGASISVLGMGIIVFMPRG